jgi:hypothetical protein
VAESSDVRLKRESDAELYFAHPPLAAFLFTLAGCGFIFIVSLADNPPPRWMYLFMAIFPAFGLLGTFWRLEIRLDLLTRRYHLRRGFWPWVSDRQGSLDELRGVVLSKNWRRRSSKNRSSEYIVWSVALDFHEDGKPISVFASRREEEARQRLEHLARKLGLPAIDRTGGEESVRAPDELDRSLQRRSLGSAAPSSVGPPPLGGIEVDAGPTGRVILLPPTRFGVGGIFLLLFGLAFTSFALLALGAALEIVPMKVSGSRGALAAIATVFTVFGTAIMALPFVAIRARERIEESGDALAFSTALFGRNFGEKRLRRDRIEEIALRDNTSSKGATGQEVFVRSDATVVTLGRDLDPEALRWLRETLAAMTLR